MSDTELPLSDSPALSARGTVKNPDLDINRNSITDMTTLPFGQTTTDHTDSNLETQRKQTEMNETTNATDLNTNTSEASETTEVRFLKKNFSISLQDINGHPLDAQQVDTDIADSHKKTSQRKRKFSLGKTEDNPNSNSSTTDKASTTEYAADNRDIKRLKIKVPVTTLNPLDAQTATETEFNFHPGTSGIKPKPAARIKTIIKPKVPFTDVKQNQTITSTFNVFPLYSPAPYNEPRSFNTIFTSPGDKMSLVSNGSAIGDPFSANELNVNSGLPSMNSTPSHSDIITNEYPLPYSSIPDDLNISDPNEKPTPPAPPKTTESSGSRSFTFWLSVFLCTNFLIGVLFIAIGLYHIKRSRRVPVQRLAPGPVHLKITPPE